LASVGVFFLITVIYFTVVRPLRENLTSELVFPLLFNSQEALGSAFSIHLETRSIIYSYLYGSVEATSFYMPQFGLFFLIGILGLWIYRRGFQYYIGLFGFHITAEVVVYVCIGIGFYISVSGFIISDFIILYLSPLVSLGFVVYASLQSRRERALKKS
jgi:hypothetical protein